MTSTRTPVPLLHVPGFSVHAYRENAAIVTHQPQYVHCSAVHGSSFSLNYSRMKLPFRPAHGFIQADAAVTLRSLLTILCVMSTVGDSGRACKTEYDQPTQCCKDCSTTILHDRVFLTRGPIAVAQV
jgi:hypothetical protein